MYSLRIENDQGEIRRIEIDKESYAIGRLDENDLVLPDINVSRQHAVIESRRDGLFLVDPGSRYGIHMHSAQLPRETPLKGGDVFVVGDYRIELVVESSDTESVDAAGTLRMTAVTDADVSPDSEPVEPGSGSSDLNPAAREGPAPAAVFDGAAGVPYTVAVSEDESLKVLLDMKRRDTSSRKAINPDDEYSSGFEIQDEDDGRSNLIRIILVSLLVGAVLLIGWFLYSIWLDSEPRLVRLILDSPDGVGLLPAMASIFFVRF